MTALQLLTLLAFSAFAALCLVGLCELVWWWHHKLEHRRVRRDLDKRLKYLRNTNR